MDFITGGVYNGKGKWVKEQLLHDQEEYSWIDGSNLSTLPDSQDIHTSVVVIYHLESVINTYIEQLQQSLLTEHVDQLLEWEKSCKQHQLIVIGTDITKGIVPLEQADRTWRDTVGFTYQYLIQQANRVFLIWFGLSEQLK